ncbi:MAG: hypothetical protein RIC95_08845 [Vicingaceae bacterium]
MRITSVFLFLALILAFTFSCRRDEEIFDDSSAQLTFSTDSVSFDTVFTTVGTTTQNFRVYNPYKETIRISSIRLNGGQSSTFRMNVDGRPGPYHENIEIAPEDSMYIFVEATVDPNNDQNPFVISDYIEFTTNGNRQQIDLVAWGQNAIYYTPDRFNRNLPDYSSASGNYNETAETITWTDSLPIVVYGYVFVDSLDQLNIEKGTKIYFHNNAGIWVYRGGTIRVNGTKEEPVIFRGDRLEMAYEDVPGQWDRIWINEGGIHSINYAVIKNAFIGIQAEILPLEPKVPNWNISITNTKILNCSGIGLLSSFYNVDAKNLLVGNCGQYNAVLRGAGEFDFTHCTFGNYFDDEERETPCFFVQNSFAFSGNQLVTSNPEVNIKNSIIYGDKDDELQIDVINNGEILFDVENSILKTQLSTADNSKFKNIVKNPPDQIFTDPRAGDFRIYETSFARNQGNITFGNQVPLDLDGNSRTSDGQPDLGVYEFQP